MPPRCALPCAPLLLTAHRLRKYRQHRLRGVDLVSHARDRAHAHRQVDVDARAEADEAEALAAAQALTGGSVAEYPPRDEPGDLDAGDVGAGRGADPQRRALVLERRFRERRVEELA